MPQATPRVPPPRAGTIAYKLDEFRRRIVGRAAEMAVFQEIQGSPLGQMPVSILFVHGPGGVGKTTLLRAFADHCKAVEGAHISLNGDGSRFEPNPTSFLSAVSVALGLKPDDNPVPFVAAAEGRHVILIDNFDAIESMEGWLRENVLPILTADTLIVLASRNPLPAAWRADAAWRSLTRVISLRNFDPEESREFLERFGVPKDQWQVLLDLTHGYPLALSLVSERVVQYGENEIEDDKLGMPSVVQPPTGVVQTLLERLVDRAPSAQHRAALEACSLLRVTTESALNHLLEIKDAHDLFEWLRSLSFIETNRPGVSPHIIAREAILADLRWRSPDRYVELHRRARNYYVERLNEASASEQRRVLWDYIFLHRENAFVNASFSWKEANGIYADIARPDDQDVLTRWVERHEGEESARIFRYWWDRTEARFLTVYRQEPQPGQSRVPVGFLMQIPLHRTTSPDRAVDPAIAAALGFLEKNAPLRPGESATYLRYWMSRDTYHEVSPVQSMILVDVIRQYLTCPDIAYSFFPIAEPLKVQDEEIFAYAEMRRLPDADYGIGARRYVTFGHDWRVQPPNVWLTSLTEKEIEDYREAAASVGAQPAPERAFVVLSEEEFRAAVRDALRDMTRPEALIKSPLLRSRVVVEQVGAQLASPPAERANALARLLYRTVQALEGAGKRDRAYRALYHTYLKPAPTQEAAADLLDIPFSTYRRHLMEGIAIVADGLWLQEIGASTK